MPPEIGIFALVLSVVSFVLTIRTRRELLSGRREGRFGRHPLFGSIEETADPAMEGLARTLERMETSQRELSRRLENLETIVTTDAGRTGMPQIVLPPSEPTAAEEAERLARRLRGA